jgi:hypothetical protein
MVVSIAVVVVVVAAAAAAAAEINFFLGVEMLPPYKDIYLSSSSSYSVSAMVILKDLSSDVPGSFDSLTPSREDTNTHTHSHNDRCVDPDCINFSFDVCPQSLPLGHPRNSV